MSNPRTDIERGVIALLRASLGREVGRYLRAIDHYNGELVGVKGYDDLKTALMGRPTAVLVTTATSRTTDRGMDRRNVTEKFQVNLYVVSTHWGSDKAQKVGDDAADLDPSLDPGINQMLWDIRGALERQKPIAGGQFMEHADDVELIPGGRGITVWQSSYWIDVRLTIPRAPAPPIESYEARNNLAPLTEPTPLMGESLVNPVVTTEGTIP